MNEYRESEDDLERKALKQRIAELETKNKEFGQEIIDMTDASLRACREDRADERRKVAEEIADWIHAKYWVDKELKISDAIRAIYQKPETSKRVSSFVEGQ